MNRILRVDTRKLAHCRMCREPMYCIYDEAIRDFCYECSLEIKADEVESISVTE
jgi:hypothetical protein